MLGLSLGKFLLLVALVALVWFGFRYVNRVETIRRALREELKRRQKPPPSTRIDAEDLVKCAQRHGVRPSGLPLGALRNATADGSSPLHRAGARRHSRPVPPRRS